MLAAIANPQPSAPSSSTWQLVFVSLSAVILLLEIIHGWRLGLIRQLVRMIAIIVAYSCGFFASHAIIAVMRSFVTAPDPALATLGGATLGALLFAAINVVGSFRSTT